MAPIIGSNLIQSLEMFLVPLVIISRPVSLHLLQKRILLSEQILLEPLLAEN